MLALVALALAQPPQSPGRPADPPHAAAADDLLPPADPTVQLPLPEQLLKVGPRSFAVRPSAGGYALFAGPVAVRDFGPDRQAADDAYRAVTALLGVSDWGTVPGRTPLDYALLNGRAAATQPGGGRHRGLRPLDLRTLRADPARGVWVVRDAGGVVVNFGPDRAAAEQAVAVCRRYGFNQLFAVGGSDQPAFRLLLAAPADPHAPPPAADPAAAAFGELRLTRTGVPVPGGGFAGERVVIDPRKVEARRDRADWVLAHGREVLARFGGDDTAAREAARLVADARVTEWCSVGGLVFPLSDGKPVSRVPFAARTTPLRADALQAVPADGRWAVAEGGRVLFPAATEAEARLMIGVIGAYRFDVVCQVGGRLRFAARTGGR